MTRTRDPFRTPSYAERAAEEIEDAIDEIRSRYNVFVYVEDSCCGCSTATLAVENNNDPNDVAYVQETPDE